MVGHAGFEPALFLNPNQVPYQARRMTVKIRDHIDTQYGVCIKKG